LFFVVIVVTVIVVLAVCYVETPFAMPANCSHPGACDMREARRQRERERERRERRGERERERERERREKEMREPEESAFPRSTCSFAT